MNITVTIPTIEKLQATFSMFPEIAGPHLRTASMQSAFAVEREAKILSPVDSGRMRASIATSLAIADKGLTSIVQTNVFYAIYVHEGTGRYSRDLSKSSRPKAHGMRPRPFMEQGAKKAESDIQKYYGKALEKTIQTIASKVQ